jgi:hypothetical protein
MAEILVEGAAPLDGQFWVLADNYAEYVYDVIPQLNRSKESLFEMRHYKPADLDAKFIKVWGAPVKYAPPSSTLHHLPGNKTAKGWFVGMQWPNVLIATPVIGSDNKRIDDFSAALAPFLPPSEKGELG